MNKILFINACTRPDSRTLELAQVVLEQIEGSVEQIELYKTPLDVLDFAGIEKRKEAADKQNFEDPFFDHAKQFASSDTIVIAAPYWDMMFPATLKTYLENVTVCGITFDYNSDGRPQGMCKAKSLYYVTTSGGYIGQNDFGFAYINALSHNFFAISEVCRFTAEGLDIWGADVESILQKAKEDIVKGM